MPAILEKYFPDLTEEQKQRFSMLDGLYREWNAKINVISRKDIDNLYEHHVLHSLSIAKLVNFRAGTRILDFGTGGGFPGIPLAILFPKCHFRMIDGTGKKILVVREISKALGLENVDAQHLRGEEERGKYNFVVSRAVMKTPDLMNIVKKNIAKEQLKAGYPERAVEVLDKCQECVPDSVYPLDMSYLGFINERNVLEIIAAYYDAGAPDKGLALAKKFVDELLVSAKFYAEFYDYAQSNFEETCHYVFFVSDILKQNGAAEEAEAIEKALSDLIAPEA